MLLSVVRKALCKALHEPAVLSRRHIAVYCLCIVLGVRLASAACGALGDLCFASSDFSSCDCSCDSYDCNNCGLTGPPAYWCWHVSCDWEPTSNSCPWYVTNYSSIFCAYFDYNPGPTDCRCTGQYCNIW